MKERCGVCAACLEVERVKREALRVVAIQPGSGDDVRLIWNTALADNPCRNAGHSRVKPQDVERAAA